MAFAVLVSDNILLFSCNSYFLLDNLPQLSVALIQNCADNKSASRENIKFSPRKNSVIDGPFTETKERVLG